MKQLGYEDTAGLARAGAGDPLKAHQMTPGFRTVTEKLHDALDKVQDALWFKEARITDLFLGATSWARTLGKEDRETVNAFLDALLQNLTERLKQCDVRPDRAWYETVAADNEAQYEHKAVEYAVECSGTPPPLVVIGGGSGSVQVRRVWFEPTFYALDSTSYGLADHVRPPVDGWNGLCL